MDQGWGDYVTADLPQTLTILYHGQPLVMTLLPDRRGYYFTCPGCGHGGHWIGIAPELAHHRLIVEDDGTATFVGQPGKSDSLKCVRPECGWHVRIRHGVAVDC
jgi:hypothetical protein